VNVSTLSINQEIHLNNDTTLSKSITTSLPHRRHPRTACHGGVHTRTACTLSREWLLYHGAW